MMIYEATENAIKSSSFFRNPSHRPFVLSALCAALFSLCTTFPLFRLDCHRLVTQAMALWCWVEGAAFLVHLPHFNNLKGFKRHTRCNSHPVCFSFFAFYTVFSHLSVCLTLSAIGRQRHETSKLWKLKGTRSLCTSALTHRRASIQIQIVCSYALLSLFLHSAFSSVHVLYRLWYPTLACALYTVRSAPVVQYMSLSTLIARAL